MVVGATTRDAPTGLLFNPGPGSIGCVAKRQVGGVNQALASAVKAQSIAHSVHDVSERHPLGGFRKSHSSSEAGVSKGFFCENEAVILGTAGYASVIGRLHVAEGETGGSEYGRIQAACRRDGGHACQSVL